MTTPNVQFHFLGQINLTQRSALKQFIRDLFKREKKKMAGMSYIFCSDDYLLDINKQYLDHDYYTDIITFTMSEPGEAIQGEVYISLDRVKDNAVAFKTTVRRELHRVIFHGALHLCGYRDKKKEEQAQMRKMEDKYLNLYLGK